MTVVFIIAIKIHMKLLLFRGTNIIDRLRAWSILITFNWSLIMLIIKIKIK